MIVSLAMTADDLLRSVDYDTSSRAGRCSPNLTGFDAQRGYVDFITRCGGSSNAWNQRIVFPDWDVLPDEVIESSSLQEAFSDFPEISDLDVKVSCNCPAFLYWGTAYTVDSLDAGDFTLPRYEKAPAPETRMPALRDPGLDRTLCKHLISVFKRYFA